MPMGLKELMAEAREHVPSVSPADAREKADLILDVREPSELKATGRVAGAGEHSTQDPRDPGRPGELRRRAAPDSAPRRRLRARTLRVGRSERDGRAHVFPHRL